MVMTIHITETITKELNKITKELPDAQNLDTKQIAGVFRNEYRRVILRKELVWTRELFNYTRVQKYGRGWGVSMPIQGIYMDRMRPHLVSPYKYPKLMAWIIEAGLVSKNGRPPKYIYVKPRPWMLEAEKVARDRIDNTLQNGYSSRLIEGIYRG